MIEEKQEEIVNTPRAGMTKLIRDNVGRMTNGEMRDYERNMAESIPRSHCIGFHLCNEASEQQITAEDSCGVRASEYGQHGGGVSFFTTPPSQFGWEKNAGGMFRNNVGKALWGSKFEEVLEGGINADKIDVLLVLKVEESITNNHAHKIPDRDSITIIPPKFLYEAPDGHHYFSKQNIIRVLYLNR